ncbi:MAG: hypothetical protein J6S21_02355, partial [Victivallales bacterium]|nr:hypothetical protein [Victivallales bacterium]
FKADGETVKVALNKSGSTVCRVRVFDPAGKEVVHYARNLDIFQGGAEYRIPFVISDAKGTWKVEVTDVVGGSKAEVSIKR